MKAVPDAMFQEGDRIGPYEIHALIGVGFMGEVYRVTHAESGQSYALKCLQMRHLGNAQLVERARREANALTQIRHANIVYVHEAGVTDAGVVWMAMELLEGRSLRHVMKEIGRMPVPHALHYACEIADGVDAAHEFAIVHRDIKPENVFVTRENKVRVLDLGTAKFFGQDMETTGRAQVFGTVPYMSPEHLAGERVDARTDIYALGMMLYEMLAGAHPFRAYFDSVLELGRAQLFQVPKPLIDAVPGLPGFLGALVEKAIEKDRELRYPSMSEFARAIRRAKLRFEQMFPASEAAFEDLKQTLPHGLRGMHSRSAMPSPPPSQPARPTPTPTPSPPLSRSGTIRMSSPPQGDKPNPRIGPYGTQVIPADVLSAITARAALAAKVQAHPVQQTDASQVLSNAMPAQRRRPLAVFIGSLLVTGALGMGFAGWWWKSRLDKSNSIVGAENSDMAAPLQTPTVLNSDLIVPSSVSSALAAPSAVASTANSSDWDKNKSDLTTAAQAGAPAPAPPQEQQTLPAAVPPRSPKPEKTGPSRTPKPAVPSTTPPAAATSPKIRPIFEF